MMNTQQAKFEVNGRPVALDVEPRLSLADALRHELGLTGTHIGCEHGVCGACTVLIDGQPMRACLALTWNCADRAITTVEALDADGKLAPIQQALLDANAVQCGFCTAGVVLSLHALLAATSHPSDAAIRDALSAHACRCTGYAAIVEAVKAVAA